MTEAPDFRSYQRQAADAADLAAERDRRKWPAECLESERKFGHRGARLYPLLMVDNGVRTPQGIGTLHQVIGGEALVLLMRTRATATGLDKKKYRPTTPFCIEEIEPYRKGDR